MLMKYVLVFGFVALLLLTACGDAPSGDFVACLAGSGATFYGSEWCGHCSTQKELLGENYDQVYVECSTADGQAEVCKTEGVRAYPTWKFEDGYVHEGLLSLDKLAKKTGCDV